nr:hypothetical protein [Tanacetum cinerariifolium]
MEHFRGMTYDKVSPIFVREYKKVQTLFKPGKDVKEPKKKRVAEETLLQESFKKLKVVEVSGSESTQETPSNDSKEMSEEDVHSMLEIIPVFEFKVEALQVKYPIIDWEIHTEGSRTYWKIIRVGGITKAYQSFEDMLKGFDREDLVALWNLVKEKFSSAVPSVDKGKALWVKLKRLFEPNADDLRALINGKKVVVTEDFIRRDLYLDDTDEVECLPNEEIFAKLVRMGYQRSPPKLTFYKAFFFAQWKFSIHTFIQKFNFSKYLFDSMVRNVDSPSKILMYPRFQKVVMDNQVDDQTSHNTRYTSHVLTQKVFANMRRVRKGFLGVETPLFALKLVQPQPQAAEAKDVAMLTIPVPPSSPPQEQLTTTSKSSMSLLTTLMETCASLSQKVAELEKDKHTQALEILKPKKMVKKMEKKKRLKHSGFKRLRKGRINQEDFSAATKDVSVVEPTVFDDEENMAGYKMEHFRAMTYDKVRPIFEREYKKFQTLFKPDKNVEEHKKKRVTEETLLQESFKKLKEVEVSGSESTQENPSNDSKEMSEEDVHNMLEIFLAYKSFKDMLKGFNKEDLVALWNLVKEKFSSAVPSVDKEKALWVELKILFEPDADDVLWKLQSAKLQVEEDNEMARNLVMNIFMEAKNQRAEVWKHPPSDQDE